MGIIVSEEHVASMETARCSEKLVSICSTTRCPNSVNRILNTHLHENLIKLPITNYLHGTESFLRSRHSLGYSRISQHFVEPDNSLPCSLVPILSQMNQVHTTPSYCQYRSKHLIILSITSCHSLVHETPSAAVNSSLISVEAQEHANLIYMRPCFSVAWY
jgi:hypothetical protein